MSQTETAVQRAIVIDRILPHVPEKIWRVLTTSELISQWLMPNDFRPALGHRFNFRTKPIGNWDGVVDCEVLNAIRRAGCVTAGSGARRTIRITGRG